MKFLVLALSLLLSAQVYAEGENQSGTVESRVYSNSPLVTLNIKGDVAKGLYEGMEIPEEVNSKNSTILSKESEQKGLSCTHFTKSDWYSCDIVIDRKSGNYSDYDE